jgi:hypothetical protein
MAIGGDPHRNLVKRAIGPKALGQPQQPLDAAPPQLWQATRTENWHDLKHTLGRRVRAAGPAFEDRHGSIRASHRAGHHPLFGCRGVRMRNSVSSLSCGVTGVPSLCFACDQLPPGLQVRPLRAIGLGKLLADGLRKRPPGRRHGTAVAMGCRKGSGSAWAAWNVTSVSPIWLSVLTPRHKCLILLVGAARFELATPSPPVSNPVFFHVPQHSMMISTSWSFYSYL